MEVERRRKGTKGLRNCSLMTLSKKVWECDVRGKIDVWANIEGSTPLDGWDAQIVGKGLKRASEGLPQVLWTPRRTRQRGS